MNIEFNDLEPIYIQIVNYFKVAIASKRIKEGEKMITASDLSVDMGVNPNTARRAFTELEREGIIFSQRGKGKYVTDDEEVIKKLRKSMSSDLVKKFISEMLELGFTKEEIKKIIDEN